MAEELLPQVVVVFVGVVEGAVDAKFFSRRPHCMRAREAGCLWRMWRKRVRLIEHFGRPNGDIDRAGIV